MAGLWGPCLDWEGGLALLPVLLGSTAVQPTAILGALSLSSRPGGKGLRSEWGRGHSPQRKQAWAQGGHSCQTVAPGGSGRAGFGLPLPRNHPRLRNPLVG